VWQGGEERPASSLLRPGLILRPHYQDGSEAGDAAYADNVNPGEELMLGPGKFGAAFVRARATRAAN
jgi:hypothetical protein